MKESAKIVISCCCGVTCQRNKKNVKRSEFFDENNFSFPQDVNDEFLNFFQLYWRKRKHTTILRESCSVSIFSIIFFIFHTFYVSCAWENSSWLIKWEKCMKVKWEKDLKFDETIRKNCDSWNRKSTQELQ